MTGFALSWAYSDDERPISPTVAACQHEPGRWWRDPNRSAVTVRPARFVTDCRKCGARLGAEGTQGGTIQRILGVL